MKPTYRIGIRDSELAGWQGHHGEHAFWVVRDDDVSTVHASSSSPPAGRQCIHPINTCYGSRRSAAVHACSDVLLDPSPCIDRSEIDLPACVRAWIDRFCIFLTHLLAWCMDRCMASRSTQPALVALFEKNKLDEVVELFCTAERYDGWWRGDGAMQRMCARWGLFSRFIIHTFQLVFFSWNSIFL
jgi:hypothetical protein